MLCDQLWQWVATVVVAYKTSNVYAASRVRVPFDASVDWQKVDRCKVFRQTRCVSGSVGKRYKCRKIPLF